MFEDCLYGTKHYTAGQAVGTSGKPVRVFTTYWKCQSTASAISLHNGTSTSGDEYWQGSGSALVGTTVDIGGMLFPDGCFLEFYTGVSLATINFREEK